MKLQALCLSAALQYALLVCSTPVEPLNALEGQHDGLSRRVSASKGLTLPTKPQSVRGSMLLEDDGYIGYAITKTMSIFIKMENVNYDRKIFTTVAGNVAAFTQKRSTTPMNQTLTNAHDNYTASTGDDPFIWTDHSISPGNRVTLVVMSQYGSQNMTWPNITDITTGLTRRYATGNSTGNCKFQVRDDTKNVIIGIGAFELDDVIPATAPAKQAPTIFNQTVEGTDIHLVLNTTIGLGKGAMNSSTMNEQLNDTLSIITEWQYDYNDEDFVFGGRNIWTWGAHSTPQENVGFGLLVDPVNGVNSFPWSVLGNIVRGLQQGLVDNGYYVAAGFRAYNKTGGEFAAGGLFNRPPFLASSATINGFK